MLAVGYEGFTGYNKIFTADDRMLYVNGNGDIVQNNDLHNLMPEHPEVLSYICNTLSPLQGVELSFETEIVNNTVVITGFKDGVSCENILIPNMLFGLPVAEIGAEAFKDRVDLNSVIISSNVALIGKNAFLDCRALESVGFYGLTAQNAVITIPDGVQIGAGAFSGCYAIKKFAASDANQYHTVVDGVLYDKQKTELIAYPSGSESASLNVPESVTKLGDFSIQNAAALTDVTLNNVKIVGADVFKGCENIATVWLINSTSDYGTIVITD